MIIEINPIIPSVPSISTIFITLVYTSPTTAASGPNKIPNNHKTAINGVRTSSNLFRKDLKSENVNLNFIRLKKLRRE